MGYSNNKWRKILTILMIINLCFILFAKFTKVLGYSSSSLTSVTLNDSNYDLDLNYLTSQYNYYILTWRNISGGIGYYYTYLDLFCSNEPMTFYKSGNTTNVKAKTGEDLINFHVFRNSDSNYSYTDAVQTWNNTVFNPSLETHTYTNDYGITVSQTLASAYNTERLKITLANYDVKDQNNDIIFNNNVISYPFFTNNTEIEEGNPDGVFIEAGDFSNTDTLYFHLLEITNGLANGDTSLYYYNDKIFALDKDSDYYRTWYDPSIDGFYYYIPRYKLGLSQNTSYLYVLNNSKNQIQNSNGVIEKDVANGIYDVVESDTTGVITATEEENDRMKNIENSIITNEETTNNINNALTNTTVSQDTQTDIDTNLNFNNNAPQFSSLFNGFFSRLTSTISDLGNYQDTDVITIYLPIPFTNSTIPIRSDFIFSNQNNNFLKNITTLLWYFIFGRYFLYFLINIYWLITNGQFFKYYLTQKEAITSDML